MIFEIYPAPPPGPDLDAQIHAILMELWRDRAPLAQTYSTEESAALCALDWFMMGTNFDEWLLGNQSAGAVLCRLSATKWGDAPWPPDTEWVAIGRAADREWPREEQEPWQPLAQRIRALAICRALLAAGTESTTPTKTTKRTWETTPTPKTTRRRHSERSRT